MRSPRIAAALLTCTATLVLTCTATLVLVAPAPAWAHSRLLSTTPAAAATVTAPTDEIALTFNEPIHQRFSVVAVAGPGGVAYGDGPVRVVDATVHQAVYPLKSGSYQVTWRAVSADDHPVQGEFRFTVALPAELEPTSGPPRATRSASAAGAAAAVPEQDRQGGWPYIALLAVLVAGCAAAAMAVAQRRRSRPAPGTAHIGPAHTEAAHTGPDHTGPDRPSIDPPVSHGDSEP